MSDDDVLLELQKLASTKKLLYIEDNDGLREKAGRLFESFFEKVFLASNGEEGLNLFKETNPDIIIEPSEQVNFQNFISKS